jgi:hypothetical protein
MAFWMYHQVNSSLVLRGPPMAQALASSFR